MTQNQNKTVVPQWSRRISAILLHCYTGFCLSGCMGIYEGGFECPPGKGVGCKSITEVNDMVNQGEFPLPTTSSQSSEAVESDEIKDGSCKSNSSKACPLASDAYDIWYAPWAITEPLPLLVGKP
ncbi:MAG: hypothetical protein K2P93_06575 [Alphaproteobacteria bacterium]|nr:hypothetical protein [Alphaproteobacteria bacterium]